MSLRFFLCVLAVQAFTASGQAKQPNIILVMPDDAGYGDYACLGNPVMRTPSVDTFKKQSLLFTRFHVSPTCAPCRGALMSGRHEFKNGITHTIGGRERMALSTFTLPQMLNSAGYATGIFGKWHLGDEEAYRPENRGFDEVYIHGSGGIGQSGDAPGNSNHDPTLWHNGKFVRTKGYCTDLFFAQAIRWMKQRHEADKPFFAFVSLNAPHAPHVLPEEYYQHYLGKPGVSEGRAKFFGMIENIDTNFGKLLTRLDEWDIADNTLVIYLGTDNGGTAGRNYFNAGLRGGKTMPYQGGTRAPCFIRWPSGDVPAGRECDALTAHVDLFPTLAKLAGATLAPAVEKQLEGRSLVPLLENPKAKWSARTLVHHVGRWPKGQASDFKYTKYSIQNADFTLVNNEELYDLNNDPGETNNVIAEHPKVVADLRAAYEKWWAEVQPYFVNEDTTGFNHFTFRELYEKQFGKAATVAAIQRSKELRAKRDKKEPSASDVTDLEKLRKLREQRRKRREGKKPVSAKPNRTKPNIVYILADDLGYGDVQCLNPELGKIETPHLDKLASQGMSFTDAHSGSSVCTPTRYGVLTGRYAWRSQLQKGVWPDNRPPLIVDGRLTVAGLLKQHGYFTSCIGKWHVGFTLEGVPQGKLTLNGAPLDSVTKDGPLTRGFDEFFGFDRLTAAPTSMFEGDRCTRLIEPVQLIDELVKRTDATITTRAKSGEPFFIYLALNSPHKPVVLAKEWQGKSKVGDYGDFIMQTDAAVGDVLASLEKAGVADNTLVIFTSDNGATGVGVLRKNYQHACNGEWKKGKKSIYEGGHRVPFFVRWPGKVKPGSQSSQLICLTDFMATCADILGAKLPDNAAEDSFTILPALLGTDKAPLHETVIHQAMDGTFAIRQAEWKLVLRADSGVPVPKRGNTKVLDRLPANELYNLGTDRGESKNLQAERPEVVARLTKLLKKIIADGRSTSGAKQANEVPIEIRKKAGKATKK